MKIYVPAIAILFYPVLTFAVDFDNGQALHADNCTRCHDASIYMRENRRVTDLTKLGTQVRFCKDNLGIMWFEEEVDDVVHYLNQKHYHY